MSVSDEAFRELSERVQKLEDLLAIYRLMASYGPSVDASTDEETHRRASRLWVEDGEYNIESNMWKGRSEIEGMLDATSHREHLKKGCSHQVSAPMITLHGDSAVAICYMTLMDHTGDHFTVVRQTANRWELARTPDGWRVVKRSNRPLDGGEDSKTLLRDGMREVQSRLGKL